jgi:uncharacterized membrane protein
MQAVIPARDGSISSTAAARRLSLVLYTLYALSIFTGGLGALVAILINHIKHRDVSKTLYGSHFRWQMRTFWWTVLWWVLVAGVLLATRLGTGNAGFVVWGLAIAALITSPLWLICRLIRGSLACIDGRRLPV